jgi:uncharacterized membrane protein
MAATAADIWNLKNFPAEVGRLGRASTAVRKAAELSRELRLGSDGFLKQRRAIVGLSFVAIGAMGLSSLYQMGVIKHLPEPPLPKLDADRVDASPEAYKRFSTPDAVLGLTNYAVTMGLAEMGGKDRVRKQFWIPLALAGKILFDVGQVLRMIRQQWTKENAFCFWCLISAATTFATAGLVFNEAREVVRQLIRRRGFT